MGSKVIQVNLEYGMPKVDAALTKMKNAIITYKGQGYKAVILIHGYGSTGVGGSIKAAVRRALLDNSLKGIVRTFAAGEQWTLRKRELLAVCRELESYERNISGNEGITVVILR